MKIIREVVDPRPLEIFVWCSNEEETEYTED